MPAAQFLDKIRLGSLRSSLTRNDKLRVYRTPPVGILVVKIVTEISDAGRAPKNTPALFVLALAAKKGPTPETRALALASLPRVARIGTHLFEFATAIEALGGGWGRGTKRAFANWYTEPKAKSSESEEEETVDARHGQWLAMQLAKYQQREGWSHRDILRLAKPTGHLRDGETDLLLRWAVGKLKSEDVLALDVTTLPEGMKLIHAYESAKALSPKAETDKGVTTLQVVALIQKYGLPRECVPTEFLNELGIWEALLQNSGKGMPITALIRNLPKMTSIGLLTPMSAATQLVVQKLTDLNTLVKGRVHPLQILVALKTYSSGHGVKGSLTWTPVPSIVDALDKAFYLSFGSLQPTNKRHLLALDVSGSMQGALIAGLPGVDCSLASCAMAMVTAAVEPNTHIISFSSHAPLPGEAARGQGSMHGSLYNKGVSALQVSPRRRLDDNLKVCHEASHHMGGTDCALPMLYALENKIPVDTFVVYTDSETWAGTIQPVEALKKYRKEMPKEAGVQNARLVCVGMTSTGFTIADPKDPGMLDVVGFDTAAPAIMAAFSKGEI